MELLQINQKREKEWINIEKDNVRLVSLLTWSFMFVGVKWKLISIVTWFLFKLTSTPLSIQTAHGEMNVSRYSQTSSLRTPTLYTNLFLENYKRVINTSVWLTVSYGNIEQKEPRITYILLMKLKEIFTHTLELTNCIYMQLVK